MGIAIGCGIGVAFVQGRDTTIRETYGALSRAQSGAGIATTATAIVSGDPSGHWQIASGRLFPSTAGDTANMNAGPYLLKLDNDDTLNITIEANTWDVATQTEWDFVSLQSTATLAGKKIALRNDSVLDLKITGATGTAFRRANLRSGGTNLVIEGRFGGPQEWSDYCVVTGVTFRGTQGVTLQHLRWEEVATQKVNFLGEASFPIDNMVVNDCYLSGQIADPNGNYTTSTNYPNRNRDMINTAGSVTGSRGSITVTNCLVQWGANLINLIGDRAGSTLTVTGNECRYFYNDAIKISTGSNVVSPATIVTDNYIHDPVGLPTDSDAVHPDAIQIIGSPVHTLDYGNITIEDNVILKGTARGVQQAIFLDDMKTSGGDSGFFFIATIRNNLIVNNVAQGIWVNQSKNCVIDGNTNVAWNAASGGTPSVLVGVGTTNATNGGGNTVSDTISDSLITVSGTTLTNNVTTGLNGGTIAYTTLFEGTNFAPATRAEAIAVFTPKAAANGAGAVL